MQLSDDGESYESRAWDAWVFNAILTPENAASRLARPAPQPLKGDAVAAALKLINEQIPFSGPYCRITRNEMESIRQALESKGANHAE